MKTFKQFQEDNKYGASTPKYHDSKNTMYPFNLIRTSDVIKRSNDDFKKSVDFPHNIPITKAIESHPKIIS